jgi:hypothetical protein
MIQPESGQRRGVTKDYLSRLEKQRFVVQPGQMGHRLHYPCVELGGGLEVMGVRHSIF